MSAEELKAALDLMRRLPPSNIEDNLSNTLALAPDLVEDLLSAVDQPLQVLKCPESSKEFILCDYNRDGDSYRSPWSNKYSPPMDDGILPPDELRKLELAANDAFDQYREQYYEGGISSCYFWEIDGGFACCVAIKKDAPLAVQPLAEGVDPKRATSSSGVWNAIHVVEAKLAPGDKKAKYKLTSTIILSLASNCKGMGSKGDLSGNLTRSTEREKAYNPSEQGSHVANIGEMVEEMEGRMRDALYEVYFGKTLEVVTGIRTPQDERKMAQQSLMAEAMAKRKG